MTKAEELAIELGKEFRRGNFKADIGEMHDKAARLVRKGIKKFEQLKPEEKNSLYAAFQIGLNHSPQGGEH